MVHLKNLSSSEVYPCVNPWRFIELGRVPANCFRDKAARDAWINRPETAFNVYTLFEGTQSNLRLRGGTGGDENPPHTMYGLAVDYDAAMTVDNIIKSLPLLADCPPNWFEQTLSGNGRLVWVFSEPIRLPNRKFALKLIAELHNLLPFRKIAGLDEQALKAPERYFTNGCRWTLLHRPKVPAAKLRGFLLKVSEKFDWQQKEFGKAANYEEIAEECKRRFPDFTGWPGEFVLGATGPSFWIDGSTSPKSAIVRETGMQTFAAHATKAFYPWAEIVGARFVEDSENNRLGKAVEGCYWDGRQFIMKDAHGNFALHTKDNFRMVLQGKRGLKGGVKRDGTQSEVDMAITYVLDSCAVAGAASCAFYPHGVFNFNGSRILNLHQREVLQPAPEPTVWGAEGKFPWLSAFLDPFFDPAQPQLDHFLAWAQHLYRACYTRKPISGHGLFLAGPVGCGKTFLSRAVLGTLFNGCQEANSYLIGSDNHNSELFDVALWVVDDGSVSSSSRVHQVWTENVKRTIANPTHRVNEKFRKAMLTPWQGRLIVTLNRDAVSLGLIPNLDASIFEKLKILGAGEKKTEFMGQYQTEEMLARELPWFARWLLDWTTPAHCFEGAESRFGLVPYAEPSIVRAANLSSGKTVFIEILTRWLKDYFTEVKPSAEFWEGTATDLRMAMTTDAVYTELLRGYKPEEFPKALVNAMSREVLKIEIADDTMTARRFRIYRDGVLPPVVKAQPIEVPQAVNSTFQKP